MALGRNLKKQSLIPSEEEKRPEKAEEKKQESKPVTSPAPKAKKVKTEKKPATPKAQEAVVPAPKVVPEPEPAPSDSEDTAKMELTAPQPVEISALQTEEEVAAPMPVAAPEEEPVPANDPLIIPSESELFRPLVLKQNVQLSQPFLDTRGRISRQEFEMRKELHTRFHKEVEAMKGKVVHLIMFKLGSEEFAIEIGKVNEVVLTPAITRMPKAPDYIPGIAIIRGKSIVTIDLSQKMGLEMSMSVQDRRKYTVVISTEKYIVGILVPNVPTNQRISGDIIQTTSDNVSTTSLDETYIKGLIKTQDRVIFFMDMDALIEGDRMQSRVAQD